MKTQDYLKQMNKQQQKTINKQSVIIGNYRSFLTLMYGKLQSNTGRLELMKQIEDFLTTEYKNTIQ